jgi:SAM-dependent methyltransferase
MYKPDLARVHHEGFGIVAQNAGRVLLAALNSAGLDRGTVVDLGCGSGILSKVVADSGYDIFGVDFSEDMLRLARQNVPSGQFVRSSVLDVQLPECVAVAAVGEVFCYAFDVRAGLEQFARVAKSIYAALRPGGIFLFDVAGPGRSGATPRTGFVDTGDWSIVHRTTEDGDTLTREITTFVRDGEAFRRADETHVLSLYRPEDIVAALEASEFETTLLSDYGDFALAPGWHAFVARKAR